MLFRMRFILAASLALLACSDPALGDIHVPRDFPTIMKALGAAQDGDTIIVAPGTYNESIDFLGKTVQLRSSDGPEVTVIDATGLDTSVVTVTSGEGPGTTLRGFTITGGTGTIDEDWRLGGGIYLDDSTLLVDNCIIEACHAADIDVDDSFGGGIAATNGADLTVKDTTIRNNSAHTGGAIAMIWDGQLNLMDSLVENNTAGATGGVVISQSTHAEVHDCSFIGNTADWAAGFNVNLLSSAHITSCTFENNVIAPNEDATTHGGGLYVFHNAVSTTIEDSHFISNVAGWGGGIYNGSDTLQIVGCTFTGNSAHGVGSSAGLSYFGGGGLFSDGVAMIEDSAFIGNTVTGPGTAISAGGGGGALVRGDASVVNCHFEENVTDIPPGPLAAGGGGIMIPVYIFETELPHIEGCTFINNHAIDTTSEEPVTYGGGVFIYEISGASGLETLVSDCTFEGNTAVSGGGMAFWGSNLAFTLTDSTFKNNQAEEDGGGLAVMGADLTVDIDDCTFEENSATMHGGGVFWMAASASSSGPPQTISSTTFIGNTADPELGVGGGLAISAWALHQITNLTVADCLFEDNSAWIGGGVITLQTGQESAWPGADWPIFKSCTFRHNTAQTGAGLNVNNSGSARVLDCTFESNTLFGDEDLPAGGAVTINTTGRAFFSSSHFIDNHGNSGGAVLSYSTLPTTFVACLFEGNTAPNDGGALWSANATHVAMSSFTGNTTAGRGGAIFNDQGATAIEGTFIDGNIASKSGGAIYTMSDATTTIASTHACNNVPDNIGGPFDDLGLNVLTVKCQPQQTRLVPHEYPTIQAAIDAAWPGDEILVSPGTYNEAINLLGKRLELRSTDGPEQTTIDASGLDASVVLAVNGEAPGTRIDGFTITGGTGTPWPDSPYGGGVLVEGAFLHIENCIITENTASQGGGIYISPIPGTDQTAGITLVDSTISFNTGPGIRVLSASFVAHNTRIESNEGGVGGALIVTGNGEALLTDCQVRENVGSFGAVVIWHDSDFAAADTLFCDNEPEHINDNFASGNWNDLGGNEFLDECPPDPIPGDINGDGVVDSSDLLILLSAWGECADPDDCPADINGDGVVDASDLLILLSNWG